MPLQTASRPVLVGAPLLEQRRYGHERGRPVDPRHPAHLRQYAGRNTIGGQYGVARMFWV